MLALRLKRAARLGPVTSDRPAVYTIPPHRAFADALAAGLIARYGRETPGSPRPIARPQQPRRAGRSRGFRSPLRRRPASARLVPVGDPELDERIGGAFEPLDGGEPIPPAVEPLDRLFLLARQIERQMDGIDAAEALRLAEDLARTLDQLLIEEVEPSRLRGFAADLPDLSIHWQASLERLEMILSEWPKLLAELGRIDLADRRNRLLGAVAARWRAEPPPGFVAAAGVTTTAPAVARLLGVVARLPGGMVILPGLDTMMAEHEWDALGPHAPDPDTGRRRPSIETHPQFQLKVLLDRMGVARAEVERWRWGGGRDAPAARSRAIANAMAPAEFTAKWQSLAPGDRRLTGVRAVELADPAEEAQAVALALREALEEPGRTAALVTPDRNLARRVSAHLRRWGIEADDSAGRPLSQTPPGTLLLALASAAAERFAPVPLLALLKHPLVMRKGDGWTGWKARAPSTLRCAARVRRQGWTELTHGSPTEAAATAISAPGPRPGGRRPLHCFARSNRPSKPRGPGCRPARRAARGRPALFRGRGLGRPRRPRRRGIARRGGAGLGAWAGEARLGEPSALARAADERGRGPPALWPASANLHLGLDRGPASAGRSRPSSPG